MGHFLQKQRYILDFHIFGAEVNEHGESEDIGHCEHLQCRGMA